MTSCNPFEYLDDTLSHDFGHEQVLEEPLDGINIFWKTQTNHPALRMKTLMMKRQWRDMYIKRKNNYDESQLLTIENVNEVHPQSIAKAYYL
jgi:hypothetical protein